MSKQQTKSKAARVKRASGRLGKGWLARLRRELRQQQERR